jgi:eukaryotic-like serine/threonine-protein kinase
MQDVTVTGNDNFVIVAGGDVYLSAAPVAPPTGDDRRNLVNLLGQVRRTWITNVLEKSVSHAALLDPRVRMEPGAVEPPWRRYLEAVGKPPGILSPDQTIGQVFGEVGKMLLILGEPGAGKTTTLLTLARECIEQAERDPAAPVPVVLNLSSWTGSRPFRDWLADELGTGYNVGSTFARRWLEEHRLLLLLDGLDEVGEDRRAACVQALHAFVQEHGAPGLVVCCRVTEYRALPVRLNLCGAVLLLPLEQAQIDAYLDAAGPALDGLRRALARTAELRELSASPLMLSIMTVAFRGLSAEALRFDETWTRDELREEIFGRFVDRMFTLREHPGGRFSRARMEDGLRWLASGMMERGSIFAVELLQPAWLNRGQLLLYTLGSRAGGAIVATIAIGAVVFTAGLVLTVVGGAKATPAGIAATALATLGAAVAMGLVTGLSYAPLGYYALRRFPGAHRREPGMVEELGVFLAYVVLSTLSACLVVWVAARGFNLSGQDPFTIPGFITIAVSILPLPVLFGRKAGRGAPDRDISLAGTLSWRWRTAVDMTIVSVLAGALLVPNASRYGLTRIAAATLSALVTFTLVTYGSWRQEVPPVDRWGDRQGNSALRESGRVFAYAGVACVLALFPLLAFALGPGQPLHHAFSLAVLVAIVLFSPALFWFGGIDLVLHATLRLVLSLTGTMPLRLRRFLDYAVHLGFLRRAGGGYIFFHRLLLEHFAARPAPNGGAAAKRRGFPRIGRSA